MRLSDIEYEILIEKYISMGYTGKALEKKLQQIDPYISLNMLKIINPHINL